MTAREAAAGLVELRRKLAGVSCHAFGGDNLAIFLASEFEPGVEDDEMDESETWKQGAIDLSNQVMDAIHAHYATAFTTLLSELESVGKDLSEFRELYAREARKNIVIAESQSAAEARALKAEKERDAERQAYNNCCMRLAEVLNQAEEIRDRAEEAEALVAEAVRVCEPFKQMADMEERTEEGDRVMVDVTHLRAARAFIEKAKS